ncbi:MAG: DNA polymerase Y family protein, partial [Notoacmeibacter sp.]|nr:DNA polymerase Y family protein [Notoacmeibacter sp.]
QPLARRFGRGLLLRIDQALGHVDEPVSPRLPVAALSAERNLAEPVTGTEQVEHLAGMLAASLKPSLEARGEGARALELALFRVDGAVARIALGTARPLRDPALVRRLFHERLAALESDLDSGFGFELLRLSVLASGPFDARQGNLAGDADNDIDGVAGFADRIAARFGSGGLMVPATVESHIPERAVEHHPFTPERLVNPAKNRDGHGVPARSLPERPIRLFRDPEPVEAMAEVPEGPPVTFRWRRALHRVAKAEGPERIEPEWWRAESDTTRDYYRIEDEAGRRYWLYRSGLYGAGDAHPRWYMHGLFA